MEKGAVHGHKVFLERIYTKGITRLTTKQLKLKALSFTRVRLFNKLKNVISIDGILDRSENKKYLGHNLGLKEVKPKTIIAQDGICEMRLNDEACLIYKTKKSTETKSEEQTGTEISLDVMCFKEDSPKTVDLSKETHAKYTRHQYIYFIR